MSELPFLMYLDLDESADERAIKRAYAVRLKKIDQETDPEGFQTLRAAYEAAQHWLRSKANESPASTSAEVPMPQGVAEPVVAGEVPADPVQHDAHDAPQAVDAGALASAVFEDFRQEPLNSKMSFVDVKRMLQRSLDDERLMNLEARAIFEWLIARLLLEGWRPGHEVLFVAAIDVFQWEADRARLLHFGPVGARMEAALSEREVFMGQTDEAQRFHTEWIRQLRTDGHPSEGFLAANMGHVEVLVSRLPNWLWVITRVERLEQWREWAKLVKPIAGVQAGSAPLEPQAGRRWSWTWWQAAMVVIFVLRGLSGAWGPSSHSQWDQPAQPSQPAWLAPMAEHSDEPQIKLDRYGLPAAGGSFGRSEAFPSAAEDAKSAQPVFGPDTSSTGGGGRGAATSDKHQTTHKRPQQTEHQVRTALPSEALQPYTNWDVLNGQGSSKRPEPVLAPPLTTEQRANDQATRSDQGERPSLYDLRTATPRSSSGN